MKIVSWNVNGLRAAITKGFYDFYKSIDADIFSIQETKMSEEQIDIEMRALSQNEYWNFSKVKKGYSGTACFTKQPAISVHYGLELAKDLSDELEGYDFENDGEGRIITLEYDNYYIVNCYTPNSKRELERLAFREKWEDRVRAYLAFLDKTKPVIYMGDLNVAHQEIDLKNPATNHNNAGFTDNERNKMTELLDAGFIDGYRYLYPDKTDEYTWYSYMRQAREKNIGWRIDYIIVSNRIKDKIKSFTIHNEVYGSDHVPIEMDLEI